METKKYQNRSKFLKRDNTFRLYVHVSTVNSVIDRYNQSEFEYTSDCKRFVQNVLPRITYTTRIQYVE